MSFKVGDRVKEYTVSTGSGVINLAGSFNSFQRFSDVMSNGDWTYYVIEENEKWEVGSGVYTSNTLERVTVFDSSDSGALVDLGGSGVVSITYPAERAVFVEDLTNSSGVADYASGVAYDNQVSLNYVSGISTYSSGQVINNESDINYVSGIAVYGSGSARAGDNVSIFNNDAGYLTNLSSDFTIVSDLASYASGAAVNNEDDIIAVSGIANYASGQSIQNEADIISVSGWSAAYTDAGDVSVSGWVDSAFIKVDDDSYVSGVATYASGQAIENESQISSVSGWAESYVDSQDHTAASVSGWAQVYTDNQDAAVSGWVASQDHTGVAVSGWADATFATDVDLVYVSGVAAAGGGGDVTTEQLEYVSGIAVYASGEAGSYDDTYVSGVSTYASGQTISNQLDISTNSNNISYVSGVANYASGQAVTNESDIATNTSNISTNTARVAYASGQAIQNESQITSVSGWALANDVSVSGWAESYVDSQDHSSVAVSGWVDDTFATSVELTYVSGISAYASGLAVVNEDDIVAVSGIAAYASGEAGSYDDTYISGIAVYSSGQVDLTTAGTAEASKAIILDSDKSFYGVKDGNFDEFDSWVRSSGLSVGGSGLVIEQNTPSDTSNTLYNVLGTLYFNGTQLASAGGASAEAQYASGLAIANEDDIVATSGIANYSSGLAIQNETDIDTYLANVSGEFGITVRSDTDTIYIGNEYVSGAAAYGSGHTLQSVTDNGSTTTNAITITDENITAATGLFKTLDMTPISGPPAHAEGLVFYDSTHKSLSVYNDEADITLQVGQEQWLRFQNETGGTIVNGDIVYISGATVGGVPLVGRAVADTDLGADAAGFATHDVEDGTTGYATYGGIVRGLDTSSFTAGEDVYISPTGAGQFTSVAPSLPYYRVHAGHIVKSDASNGEIWVQFRRSEPDYFEISQIADGMAFDKADIYVVESAGTLYFEVEKTGGGGNMDFLIDGSRSTLDCTTGAGTGGRARVALTAGSDANTPQVNYLYVTDGSGTATLVASTSLPTGAFCWIAKVVVPDATTWATSGEYGIQRYTDAFSNSNRGALSHAREKLRALGAVYISGGSQTLTIDTGQTPDSVHLEVGSASVYQLHRQTFPAFTTGPYYYGNGQNIYESITDLNAALALQDGTAITNNDRYNLVLWGAVNYESGDCKLFVNLPNDTYGSDAAASADGNATADYSVPDNLRSVAFLIARVVLKYTTGAGGTFTEVDTFSLLGTPVGIRSGGAGVVANTEFVDSTFKILDNTDATKEIQFEASGITTGTTRTYIGPDQDGHLALLQDVYGVSGIANYASGQAIANESDIVATSGIAAYSSGQVDITTDGTAEASKALILDSNKSFTGVKNGTFNEHDSWVYSSGIEVGTSGIIVSGVSVFHSGIKTPLVTDTDQATITFDMNQSNVHIVTLGDNRTLAVSNVDVGQKFLIRLQQDSTGSRTVTWFTNILWSDGGTEPTLTTTADKADLFGFLCTSGNFYDGFICGQNI